MSIKLKLIIFIVIPVIIVIGTTSFISFKFSEENQVKNVDKLMKIFTSEVSRNINYELQSIENMALSGADFVQMSEFVTDDEAYDYLKGNLNKNFLILGARFILNQEYYGFDKKIYSVSKKENKIVFDEISNLIDLENENELWYQVPRKTGNIYWDEPFIDRETKVPCTRVNVPVIKNNKFVGVASILIDLTKFREFVDNSLFKSFNFVIISNKGQFIYHPNEKRILNENMLTGKNSVLNTEDQKNEAQKMMKGLSGKAIVKSDDGKEILYAYYYPIPLSGWSISISVEEDEILETVIQNQNLSLITIFITILIIIFIIYLMSIRITNPLNSFIKKVNLIANGDRKQTIEVKSNDEIGKLASAFNSMSKEILQREAELKDMTQRFKLAFKASNDGIFDWNLKTGDIYFSERMFKLF